MRLDHLLSKELSRGYFIVEGSRSLKEVLRKTVVTGSRSSRIGYADEERRNSKRISHSLRSRVLLRILSGDDAIRGNTRPHLEHDG